MTDAEAAAGQQAGRWRGAGGDAWVRAASLIEPMFGPLRDLLVESIDPTPGARVLDVGCGTGDTTVALARRVGPEGRVVGLDVSESMAQAARERIAREDLQERAEVVVGDAEHHDLSGGGHDAVVSRFGVMFFADPVRAFANLRTAVRPGGALSFLAWRAPRENPFMLAAETAAAPLLAGLPARRADEPGQFGLAGRERLADILERSGWHQVTILPVDVPCSLPAERLEEYALGMGAVGPALAGVEPELRARVERAVLAAFEPYIRGDRVRFLAACWLVGGRVPATSAAGEG